MKSILHSVIIVITLTVGIYAVPPEFFYNGDKLTLKFKDVDRISSTFLDGYITIDFYNFKKFHINRNWIVSADDKMNEMTIVIAFPTEIEIEKDKKIKILSLFFPFMIERRSIYKLLTGRL